MKMRKSDKDQKRETERLYIQNAPVCTSRVYFQNAPVCAVRTPVSINKSFKNLSVTFFTYEMVN